jgi:hypothetical protein
MTRPYKTHGHRCDSGHAETENQGGHDELFLSSHVDLENRHMGCSTYDEQNKKDSVDGIVDFFCGQTS